MTRRVFAAEIVHLSRQLSEAKVLVDVLAMQLDRAVTSYNAAAGIDNTDVDATPTPRRHQEYRCGRCLETGHNARTCDKTADEATTTAARAVP